MPALVKPQLSYRRLFRRNLILGESFAQFFSESKSASSLNYESFAQFFKTCAKFKLLEEGASAHAGSIKMGFDSHSSTSNSIMSFYFKAGMKDCALNMFDQMPRKDSVSWNAVIHGSLTQKDAELGLLLFAEAMACGFAPNVSTLVLLLQASWMSRALTEGGIFHGFIIKSGFTAEASVQNSLISLYGKSKDPESAQKMFDELHQRDVVSWSSLISAYAQTGGAATALQLFRNLPAENGIEVDALALVSVLQACSSLGHANYGKSVHGRVILSGFESDLFVGNSLIDMYSKCLDVDSAYEAFAQMPRTNLVSWNCVLSGSIANEKHLEALELFESMKKAGIEGDAYTAVILLQACKKLGQEAFCRSIHSMIVRKLLEPNDFVLNSLLDAYTKCGLMGLALKLFEKMPRRDVISWSTVISGFSQCGEPRKAVAFFIRMRSAQVAPNSVTLLSLLEACSVLADLKVTKCVNGVAVKCNLSEDLTVATALLDTYAKCGNLDFSRKIFDGMTKKNVLSWNAMIGALGMNGRAREALAALDDMSAQNVKPNGVTILSALSACSHGGLIPEGLSLFQRMFDVHSVQPNLEHYSCIVDMLARAGDLANGFDMIMKMSEAGVDARAAAWGALLGASRRFGCHEIGRGVARRVLELEPLSSAGYVLSSSMCAKAGLRDEAAGFRVLMRERGVRVVSGYSLVQVGQHAKKFVTWDESDPRAEEIYSMAGLLHCCMKRYEENDLFLEFTNHS